MKVHSVLMSFQLCFRSGIGTSIIPDHLGCVESGIIETKRKQLVDWVGAYWGSLVGRVLSPVNPDRAGTSLSHPGPSPAWQIRGLHHSELKV